MKTAIKIISNIIDYDSNTKWGAALRHAVKKLEEEALADTTLCSCCKIIERNGKHSWYCRKCDDKL